MSSILAGYDRTADAVGEMSGGDYAFSGGFWERFVSAVYELFLPLIMR